MSDHINAHVSGLSIGPQSSRHSPRCGALWAMMASISSVYSDRNQILFLAERRIPRQRLRIGANAGSARQSIADMDNRTPLCETGAHVAVGRKALPEPVEALGHCFAGKAC